MANELYNFLRVRASHSYRMLLRELDGLSEKDAIKFVYSDWPDHRWGVGQNGSIAGIVYHVAAWKQMTLPVFQVDGRLMTTDEFQSTAELYPGPADWHAVLSWLQAVGDEWNREMLLQSPEGFESSRDWEGKAIPVRSFVVEMYEHDIQHASQIAYLKQRLGCASEK